MKYFLDTEFDGEELVSLALACEDGRVLYLISYSYDDSWAYDQWVNDNVLPVLHAYEGRVVTEFGPAIAEFLDADPVIISDWPKDIEFFCRVICDSMDLFGGVSFEVVRVDAWPNDIEGAVQHNAAWDAIALRAKCSG
jgi:hypothetical protein